MKNYGRRDMSEQSRVQSALGGQDISRAKDDIGKSMKGNQTNNEFYSPFRNNYNNIVREFPVSNNADRYNNAINYQQQQQQQPPRRGEGSISLHNNEGKTSVKVHNPPGNSMIYFF